MLTERTDRNCFRHLATSG